MRVGHGAAAPLEASAPPVSFAPRLCSWRTRYHWSKI